MIRLAWFTDVHLDFLSREQLAAFLASIEPAKADAILLGGDISNAARLSFDLCAIRDAARCPVYFVLGNHDYYGGSIAAMRKRMRELCGKEDGLTYLSQSQPIPLTDETALIGHDGWGDGLIGDRFRPVELNDEHQIVELMDLDGPRLFHRLKELGEDAAGHIRQMLDQALAQRSNVLMLTHVPPFRESAWYDGRISSDEWLPRFTCAAVGDVLGNRMSESKARLTVLCGHTHGAGEVEILTNLRVLTGGSTYGRPAMQRIIEVP